MYKSFIGNDLHEYNGTEHSDRWGFPKTFFHCVQSQDSWEWIIRVRSIDDEKLL